MLSAVYAVVVCLCVCVCLSHSGIVSKRVNICQEWLKLKLSNFVQRETILSLAKVMTNKRGMVLLT